MVIAYTVIAGSARGIQVKLKGSPIITHSMVALKIRFPIQSSLEVIDELVNEQGHKATLRATRKFVLQDMSNCDSELKG